MPRKRRTDSGLYARRLRMALAEMGWSAAELGRKVGASRQVASAWTRGDAVPKGETALLVASLLGKPPEWFGAPMAGVSPREGGSAKRQQAVPASELPEAILAHPIRDRLSGGPPGLSAHSEHPGNTPVMTTSGEEPISGSPGPDEVGMALAILQRAFMAALQPGVDTQARREWLYWTLVGFAGQLGQQQFQDVAQALTQVAEVLRNGGISG